MIYRFIKSLVSAFFRVVFLTRYEGRENVPKEGGLLLCTNHRSYWDPPAVAVAFPRRLTFLAKEELFRNPLFAALIRALGAFPIRRGKGDAGAIMTMLKVLKSGETTLVFPEGTRVFEDNGERKVHSGIIKVAIKARVPIVPGYTNGRYTPFGSLKVSFGKPISYEEYYDCPPDDETLERLTAELMRAIYSFAEVKK